MEFIILFRENIIYSLTREYDEKMPKIFCHREVSLFSKYLYLTAS